MTSASYKILDLSRFSICLPRLTLLYTWEKSPYLNLAMTFSFKPPIHALTLAPHWWHPHYKISHGVVAKTGSVFAWWLHKLPSYQRAPFFLLLTSSLSSSLTPLRLRLEQLLSVETWGLIRIINHLML